MLIGLTVMLGVCGSVVLVCAVVFSRYVFDSYVRRHHPDVYRRLTEDPMLMFATDASKEMARFRVRIDDDLGDKRLRTMKLISQWLYGTAVGLWGIAVILMWAASS